MRGILALHVAAALLAATLFAPPARSQSVGPAMASVTKAAAAPATFRSPAGSVATARIRLAAPDPAALAAIRSSNAGAVAKAIEIGIGREVAGEDAAALALARWSPAAGGRALRWEITSSEALATRIAVATAGIDDRVEVRLAGSARTDVVFGPFSAAELRASGAAWWSPVLEGDTAIVEWFVAGDARDPSIELARLSHLFVDPADPKAESMAKAAGACEVNFICRASIDPALAQTGKSVARLAITRAGGGTVTCTGTLLNSTDGSFAPYFASATHCISTPREAASVVTYWFYETSACTGTALNPAQMQLSGGSTLLFANEDSDFTLVRLNSTPPAAAIYAGWDAATITSGSAVTAVHHPQGDVKKVSLGAISGFESSSLAAGSFIRVHWNSSSTGVVEPGSSGGGIFTNGSLGYRWRGGLNGGASACGLPADQLYDWYSRLDLAYPFVAQWLNPASAPALGANNAANPGFESGASSWQQTTTASTAIVTNDSSAAHAGNWYAWMGGAEDLNETLTQAFTVPQGPARLQFWYRIDTAETTATQDRDRLTISLLNANGSGTLATLGTFSNLNATTAWALSPVYDLSAFGGQSVRLQFRATNDFLAPTSFRIDDVVVATTASLATANQTALWWNPNESGWGLNANQQGGVAFATLFTYDASGAPMWLVMSEGRRQGGGDAFVGPLYRTTGPPFNANPFTPLRASNVTEVGSMTLDFSASGPTIGYTYNGAYVSKSIQKQVFGARAAVCQDTTGSRVGATNYQDLWWNPAESGWGLNVTQQGETIFATLFSYAAGAAGSTANPGLWLVMPNGARQSDGSYSGDLLRTNGPPFNAQPWFQIGSVSVGTMRLRFQNGETGTLEYSVSGVSVTKTITRQVFGSPVPFCVS